MQLYRIDYGIIEALQNDGRLSNKELASRVGFPLQLSGASAEAGGGGVIEGYHARVSPRALGIHMEAIVYVRLASHTPRSLGSSRSGSRAFPRWSPCSASPAAGTILCRSQSRA